MPILKNVRKLWHKDPSGLLFPNGTVSNLSITTSNSFIAIKEKAMKVEAVFDDASVTIPGTSDLSILISSAIELSDSWLTKKAENIPFQLLFQTAHFERIADAVLPLGAVPNRATFLKKLTSGSLNFFERTPSHAKDILWELELWSVLLARGFHATLAEPDIVVEFGNARIAIPCKKIYSPNGTSKVLSNAVKQIERDFDFGIVAINIDDITPENAILQVPTYKQFGDFVSNLNVEFIKGNERFFRKYLSAGRIISALVSTTLLADIQQERVRFNNSRQSTIWTIPDLEQEKHRQLDNFYRQLMQ